MQQAGVRMRAGLRPGCWLATCLFAQSTLALGATPAVLHSFDGTDGKLLRSRLIQGRDGSFYGTAYAGGIQTELNREGCGTVYKITPQGQFTVLHRFAGGPNGCAPWDELVQGADGNFYGTTHFGGEENKALGPGTVFRITAAGEFTRLVSFKEIEGGSNPAGHLIQARDGNFYGLARMGRPPPLRGRSRGDSGVYQMTPDGAVKFLHVFYADQGLGSGVDGALVEGPNGDFYGPVMYGFQAGKCEAHLKLGCGGIFKITPAGAVTVLYKFDGSLGTRTSGPLTRGSDGNFYAGTLNMDRGSDRPVFSGAIKMTPAGKVTLLHEFDPGNPEIGAPGPNFSLGADGNFYGAADVVFRMTLRGEVTPLYDRIANNREAFSNNPAAGKPLSAASGAIRGSDGAVYAVSGSGGTSTNCQFGCGTVFKVSAEASAPASKAIRPAPRRRDEVQNQEELPRRKVDAPALYHRRPLLSHRGADWLRPAEAASDRQDVPSLAIAKNERHEIGMGQLRPGFPETKAAGRIIEEDVALPFRRLPGIPLDGRDAEFLDESLRPGLRACIAPLGATGETLDRDRQMAGARRGEIQHLQLGYGCRRHHDLARDRFIRKHRGYARDRAASHDGFGDGDFRRGSRVITGNFSTVHRERREADAIADVGHIGLEC